MTSAHALRVGIVAGLVGAFLALGCGTDGEPLGDTSAGTPELAGPPGQCDAAPPPIPALVDAQFTGGQRNAVRAKCANVLRKSSKQPSVAFKMALELADFIRANSQGSAAHQAELISAFLCVSQGQAPGGSCSFAIPSGSEVNVVGPGGGGPFFVDDGKIGYLLSPGWSKTTRIVFTIPGDCALDTPFNQYPECATHGTIPDGPFAQPQSGILAHCATVPDSVDPANLRLARNIDSFNDPNATDDGGSEHFSDFTPPFTLPSCGDDELVADRVPGSRPGVAPGLAAGGKRGPTGAKLAITLKVQGGQISSFSEWGIVDIGSASSEIVGRIVRACEGEGCPEPIRALVDLFCDDGISEETPAGPTIIADYDGTFSFSSDEYDFAPGSTCLVEASAEGFDPNSSDTFTVDPGTNDIGDIFLEVLDY